MSFQEIVSGLLGHVFKKEAVDKLMRKNLAEAHQEKARKRLPEFGLKEARFFEFPKIQNIQELDLRYDLLPPFAQAHIRWNKKSKEVIYKVVEPSRTEKEKIVVQKLKKAIETNVTISYSELDSQQALINYLEKVVSSLVSDGTISIENGTYQKLMYYIYRDFAGLNDIEAMLHDPYIEDIGCDGVGVPVFVVHSKLGSIKTNIIYYDEVQLRGFVVKLAERCGKYISYAEPLLDGTLPDGSRVNASFSRDVTSRGPTFSIRKFHAVPFSSIDLLDLGTTNADILAYLWMAIQHRKNILVTGGTDVGKTSMLNAIVTFIPPEDKIVSIEDTRELKLPHENWIPAVARPSYNLTNKNESEITMFHLLKESFRQNPDYVLVGEVRGEEAAVLFQGMASGNSSMATMHASSPNTVIKRLITPPINLSPTLVETLDIVIVMTRARDKGKSARRAKAIYEIEGVTESQNLRTNELFAWTAIDDSFFFKGVESSRVLDEIRKTYGISRDQIREEFMCRRALVKRLQEENIRIFADVAEIISEYYRDRQGIVGRFGLDKSTDRPKIAADIAPTTEEIARRKLANSENEESDDSLSE